MRNIRASQQTLDDLDERGIVAFSAAATADDWMRKGIPLLHDLEARSAAVLPALPRYLRDNRDRVVHLVSAMPAKAAADLGKVEKRE